MTGSYDSAQKNMTKGIDGFAEYLDGRDQIIIENIKERLPRTI